MKTKISKLIIALVCVVIAQKVLAQDQEYISMEYSYDGAGNRIGRSISVNFMGMQCIDSTTTDTITEPKPATQANSLTATAKPITQNDSVNNAALLEELQPNVYPSPTAGNITVELLYNMHKLAIAPSRIQLYDSRSILVYTTTTNGSKEQIDLSHYAAGYYYVVIESDKNRYVYKILKH